MRELARATVGAASLAAAELLAARRGESAAPPVRVREGAVATAFVSERHLRIDGRHSAGFAPLSRFWPAADGWVRTHANYPHHRARLLRSLGVEDIGDDGKLVARMANLLAGLPAEEIQDRVYAGGGLAVRVAPSPVARTLPLVEIDGPGHGDGPGGDAPVTGHASRANGLNGAHDSHDSHDTNASHASREPGGPREARDRTLPPAALPAQGVRVLDLTRVIAGPVATRTLALLGADVLRIDSPRLPETPEAHAETGLGKRSALLDLAASADRAAFDRLLASADVLVTGYRPGALDRLGLAADDVLARHPGLVVAQLSAWGFSDVGAWAGRRGFDSLVQAATGIAALEGDEDGNPGALPAQALDHGTGYLLAAAVLRCLTVRRATGAGARVRLSLAGTAQWLLHGIAPDPLPGPAYVADQYVTEPPAPGTGVRHALSPVHYDGSPADWNHLATPWGSDTPNWL
ncbi:CoA transferase [Streptomyces fuscigenes]|nr:CoA transferase [Streptomyces fuscigenes]